MGTTSSSPYDIGEEVSTKLKSKNWHWTLHRGSKRGETGSDAQVSIFRTNWTNIGNKAPLAKHAFTKTRTLRHPKLLHLHDGTDGETECMIVTEEVTPFVDWIDEQSHLSDDQLFSLLSCGLFNILQALNFMHQQNIIHGTICPESIFVTKSGEFKLWGLECASNLSGSDFGHFQTSEKYLENLSNSQYRSPERSNNDWDSVIKNFALVDVWSVGQLIPKIFEHEHFKPELIVLNKKMTSYQISNRLSIHQILNSNFFISNPMVTSMIFLDEMQLKNHKEIVLFFKTLPKIIKKIPNSILIHKIMPSITAGVTRSIGPDNRPEDCRDFVSVTLPIIAEIGKNVSEELFRLYIVPAVLPLFTVSDRSVRIQLLERIDMLIQHMDDTTINETIFDALNGGFVDTAKQIRELTLKSMLTLAPKLNEKNLNDRLMRSLSKLQTDPEPSVRTNTTIFFGKIAGQLQSSNRLRVIVPVFLRAMKDPFPYGRLAAVRAMAACKTYYDANLIVGKLLPTLTSLLLDPYGPVRDATFDCINVLLEPVKVQSDFMKKEEEARKERQLAEEKAKKDKEQPKVGELTNAVKPQALPSSSLANTSSSSVSNTSISSLMDSVSSSQSMTTNSPEKQQKSSLGFRSTSDSSFWDAIDNDSAAMIPTTSSSNDEWGDSGWGGDGWGGGQGDEELDGLDDLDEDTSSNSPSSSTTTSLTQLSAPLFAKKEQDSISSSLSSVSLEPKKSVQERRLEAKQKRESRTNQSKKLTVEKLKDDVKTDDWEW